MKDQSPESSLGKDVNTYNSMIVQGTQKRYQKNPSESMIDLKRNTKNGEQLMSVSISSLKSFGS